MYVKCKDILTYIYINLFLNCFSYPNEDQAVYDEERQVQRIHVNSNAEKRSQYQAYSQKSTIPQVQVNYWTDPLRLKSEEKRNLKMMT